MTRADLLEAWTTHLAQGRRRSPHTVRAYGATAARLLDTLGETNWPNATAELTRHLGIVKPKQKYIFELRAKKR